MQRLAFDRRVWKRAAVAKLKRLLGRVDDLERCLDRKANDAGDERQPPKGKETPPDTARVPTLDATEAVEPVALRTGRRPAPSEPKLKHVGKRKLSHANKAVIAPACCEHVPYRFLGIKCQVPPTPPVRVSSSRTSPSPSRPRRRQATHRDAYAAARSPEEVRTKPGMPNTYVVAMPF